MARKRHKKRTHVPVVKDDNATSSMVIKIGDTKRQTTKALSSLVRDFRTIMQPNTAVKLKERKANRLKDFLVMAGPLGVSHFFLFSQSEAGNTTLRIARTPRGPTLYFRVLKYSLSRDIQKSQKRPRSLKRELQSPPILVLNNFSTEKTSDKGALLTSMFQNMFPSLNINTANLASISRVLLVNQNPDTETIDMRHYVIEEKLIGPSSAINKLKAAKQGKRKVPDLHNMSDVAEYLVEQGISESEGEEELVDMPTEQRNTKMGIKLVEVGPRLELKLIKVEEGLCQGKTLYHATETRTEANIKDQEKLHQEKDALRLKRRRQQEDNVRKKQELKKSKRGRMKRGAEKEKQEGNGEDGSEDEPEQDQAPETMNDYELEAEAAFGGFSSNED